MEFHVVLGPSTDQNNFSAKSALRFLFAWEGVLRAGIVQDPAEYRWSSYGEAMGATSYGW